MRYASYALGFSHTCLVTVLAKGNRHTTILASVIISGIESIGAVDTVSMTTSIFSAVEAVGNADSTRPAGGDVVQVVSHNTVKTCRGINCCESSVLNNALSGCAVDGNIDCNIDSDVDHGSNGSAVAAVSVDESARNTCAGHIVGIVNAA